MLLQGQIYAVSTVVVRCYVVMMCLEVVLLIVTAVISLPSIAILFYLAYHGNETPVADSVEIMDCYTDGQLCCSAVQGVATLGCSGV